MILRIFCFIILCTNTYTKEFVITSFPQLTRLNQERYMVSSFQNIIYTDFKPCFVPGMIVKLETKKSSSYFLTNIKQIKIVKSSYFSSILQRISLWRIEKTKQILQNYPLSGALIVSLVLGNRYFLENDFLELVRFSGLAHILALSGLHLVIFVGLLTFFLRKIGIFHRYIYILTLPISIVYLCIGGAGISLQRAILFHFLISIFKLFRIPTPSVNIFIIALIINISISHNYLYNISFWLSYLSVAGIVFCCKFWYDIIRNLCGKILASFLSVSLSASIIISPVLIWIFGYINIYSAFSSLLVVSIMPILLSLCFSSFMLNLPILDTAIFIIYKYIFEIANFFSGIPYGVIFVDNIAFSWVITVLVFIFMVGMVKRFYAILE